MSSAATQDVSDPAEIEPTVELPPWRGAKPDAEGNSAFFYGTLMHPRILRRVISNDASHLEICSAILFSHTRLHVQARDYPAVVPSVVGQNVMEGKTLGLEDQAVRGVVVRGLTERDVALLDVFEGDEYRRESITAVPISSWSSVDDARTEEVLSKSSTLPDPASSLQVPAFVYLWDASISDLEPEIWRYDAFVNDKLWRWLDREPTDEVSDNEVSRRLNMAGIIVAPEGGEGTIRHAGEGTTGGAKPQFGHCMLKHFGFAKGYINLNHGAFGSTPLAVTKYFEEVNRLSEARPDPFFRTTSRTMLNEVRESLAKLIGAETDECVCVPNATHGINTILRNFVWEDGDILVDFSTSYYAVKQTLRYFGDTEPHPTVHTIPLNFPTTHAEILKTFREHMEALPDTFGQKVVVVIDSMASNPGVRLPWEEMVSICKEYKAWSLIDAAHGVGMTPVNVSHSRPDFWVSNCHKWLMTKRGCAVMYVPRRNQHLIRTSFPTSWGYVSPPQTVSFASLFEYTGTIDYAPYLSVKAALDFRESIGGEDEIQQYCDSLALEGGKRMAEILGTETMDPQEEYTGPMTNVRIPLAIPSSAAETAEMTVELMNELLRDYDAFVAFFVHNGSWWVRASTQIWNDLSDFEYVAKAVEAICEKRKRAA